MSRAGALSPSGAAALLAAALCTGGARAQNAAEDGVPRAILMEFDDAWRRADLDAIMRPVSPTFGCELYGKIDYGKLRTTYEDLLGQLPGSTCRTEVLRLLTIGESTQAFICRNIDSASGQPLEQLCHVVYLQREGPDLRIVGLEEYDAEGLLSLRGGAYDSDAGLFSFPVPEGVFLVPCPKIGFALERVLLRGMDLQCEIELFLLQTSRAYDLERALDTDLQLWSQENAPAKVELRTPIQVAGRTALRAQARYYGAECALSARQKKVERRLIRVYVRLDERFLLAIDLRCPKTILEECVALFDALLGSLRVDVPEGMTYGEAMRTRRGWGKLPDNRFEKPEAGFLLQAPPDFEIEAAESGSLFSLRAHRLRDPRTTIQIDGVELMDPSLGIPEMIAVDDAAYSRAAPAGHNIVCRKRVIGGRTVVQVDRQTQEAASDRFESVIYLRGARHLFTVRVVGTLDEVKRASSDLDTILATIKIEND